MRRLLLLFAAKQQWNAELQNTLAPLLRVLRSQARLQQIRDGYDAHHFARIVSTYNRELRKSATGHALNNAGEALIVVRHHRFSDHEGRKVGTLLTRDKLLEIPARNHSNHVSFCIFNGEEPLDSSFLIDLQGSANLIDARIARQLGDVGAHDFFNRQALHGIDDVFTREMVAATA